MTVSVPDPTKDPGAAPPAPPGPEPRRRSPRRRALRALSTVLMVVGALLVADAVLTVVWQEPSSAVYARVEQGRLDDELAELDAAGMSAVDRRALARLRSSQRRVAFAARSLARRVDDGRPLGRIRARAIGLSSVFVAGTGTRDLRRGPGHYPGTPLPGARGTVGIAGHRTTYGAPFREVDRLRRGHRIELDLPYGRFVYAVERTRIVAPTAVWVTNRVSYDRLVLSACHPLYSAAQRMVVFARLVGSEPRGATVGPAPRPLRQAFS